MFSSNTSTSGGIPIRGKMELFYARSTLSSASLYATAPIAVDTDGSIYLARNSLATGYTGYCSFLNKVNQQFQSQWGFGIRTNVNTTMNNYPTHMKVASSGNVYVLGFDQYGGGNYESLHLYKINSSGTIQWSRMVTDDTASPQYLSSFGLTIDSSENIYIGGSRANKDGVFIFKYNSSGTLLATQHYQSSAPLVGTDLVLDEANSCLYIVGYWNDGNNPDQGTVYKIPTSLGIYTWTYTYHPTTASISRLYSGAIDSSGNLICVGTYHQSALPEREQIYYAKITPSGSVSSSFYYEDASFAPSSYYPNYYSPKISRDLSGNFFLSAIVNGANATAVSTASPYWGTRALIMKLNSSADITWQYLSSFGTFQGNQQALDATGNFYVSLQPNQNVQSTVIAIPSAGIQTGEAGATVIFSPSPLTKQSISLTRTSRSPNNNTPAIISHTGYTSVTNALTVVTGDLYDGTIKCVSHTYIDAIRLFTGTAQVKLPTNLQQNDLVVVICSTTASAADLVAASTFTDIVSIQAADTNDSFLYMGYKFMGATPDTTVSVGPFALSANSGCLQVLCFRGVNTTTPLDVTTTTATVTNTAIIDAPSITPVTSGALVISAIGGATQTTLFYNDQDGSWSGTCNLTAQSTYNTTLFVGIKKWVSGTFNPSTPTISTSDSTTYSATACTFALRPQ